MGIFDFVKNAGSAIFGGGKEDKLDPGRGFSGHLRDHGIDPSSFRFAFDGDRVTVEGRVPDQDTREKAVLIIGNVEGVAQVDDRLRVGAPPAQASAPPAGSEAAATAAAADWPSRTYTVVAGDTLSAIAKKMYGDAGRYPVIFEANRPMLSDPDRIYPGQVLRVPPLPA